MTSCPHRWRIETQSHEGVCAGVCTVCGAVKQFRAQIPPESMRNVGLYGPSDPYLDNLLHDWGKKT